MEATADNLFKLFFRAGAILLSADGAVELLTIVIERPLLLPLCSPALAADGAVGRKNWSSDHRFHCHSALLVVSQVLYMSIIIGRFRCNSALLLLSRHTTASVQPLSCCVLAADGAVGLQNWSSNHRFPCNSALLQTPYHGKHGAHSYHHGSYEHCKHLVHYHAVYAESEPAKACEEATAAW
ncbi:hypothetical protein UY3_04209 [Chelonia mydas]|uniref:Uncharacterized protein n=1 Tax=Chelonia mydas TaxID=8469 RepID=M7BS25_CHEMY|nr:hypothetical protein UY3_04209 [Chelonia mydas]